MPDSLKQKAAKGVLWSTIERFSVQGVQFLIMIVMARLLTPHDYGIIGMLAIFIAVAQSLIDSGFSQALIRKQNRTETDNNTVFYFNIVVSGLLYFILYISAPFVADFYNTPQLCPVMRVVCISIIFNSLAVVQRALLTIKIDFKTQAKAALTAAVTSGVVGITMAYHGFGVWSLVTQQLLNLGINTSLLWLLSKWRPRLIYSWQSFHELFAFGSKLLASGLLDTIYRNIYPIVIGKLFSASNLGHYTRAHQFSEFPSSNLTGIIQRVTYPVLCEIQNDDARLAGIYRKFLKLSAFIIFPLMIGLSSVSRPFISIMLGQQWEFCGQLLQIICFSMMWYPIHAINLNLLQVKGRSDLFLRLEIKENSWCDRTLHHRAVWSYCDVLWFNSQFARSISDKHLLHRQTDQCRFFQTNVRPVTYYCSLPRNVRPDTYGKLFHPKRYRKTLCRCCYRHDLLHIVKSHL